MAKSEDDNPMFGSDIDISKDAFEVESGDEDDGEEWGKKQTGKALKEGDVDAFVLVRTASRHGLLLSALTGLVTAAVVVPECVRVQMAGLDGTRLHHPQHSATRDGEPGQHFIRTIFGNHDRHRSSPDGEHRSPLAMVLGA